MGLEPARLTCDECGGVYDDGWGPDDPLDAKASKMLGRAKREDKWAEMRNGIFCPACVAKADRGTLVVETPVSV